MRFNILSLVAISTIAALGSNAQQQQQQPLSRCAGIDTRPNVLRTAATWSSTIRTLEKMNKDGFFAWFAYLHSSKFSEVHNNSMLLPFHRMMLRDFELAAKRYYDPNFVIPYWDAAQDYQKPHLSKVLTSQFVGGNGGPNGCVQQDCFQSSWTMSYPNSHCLARKFDGPNDTISPWFSPEYVLSFTQRDNTMTSFRPDLEYSIHGAVHLGIGGDMLPGWSPNDFIFYLHHANMDRLWAIWQYNYSHTWQMDGSGPNGIQDLSINDMITTYNVPISSVMQLEYGTMCYNYDDISTNTIEASIRKLPQNILTKYFPVTAQSANNSTLRARSPIQDEQITLCNNTSNIALPVDLSKHLYDKNISPEVFAPIQADQYDFVKDLNENGYSFCPQSN